jgi:hypothetical protein
MRVALATLAATLAAVLLLAGCGHAKDPFVGTWQSTKGGGEITKLVIIKKANVYWTVVVLPTNGLAQQAFSRRGNQLVAQWSPLLSQMDQVKTVDFDPKSGHLHFGLPVVDYEMTKVSASAAIPTPSP